MEVLVWCVVLTLIGCGETRSVSEDVAGTSALEGRTTLGDVARRVFRDDKLTEMTDKVVTEMGEVVRTAAGLMDFSVDSKSTDVKEDEGRHFKRKKMMMRMALWLKTLALGVVLPGAVGLALFAAWKGITLSLMALLLAGIVGLKGLIASASKGSNSPHHVVLSGVPTHHQHYWKRSDDVISDSSAWGDSSHQLAYQAYQH